MFILVYQHTVFVGFCCGEIVKLGGGHHHEGFRGRLLPVAEEIQPVVKNDAVHGRDQTYIDHTDPAVGDFRNDIAVPESGKAQIVAVVCHESGSTAQGLAVIHVLIEQSFVHLVKFLVAVEEQDVGKAVCQQNDYCKQRQQLLCPENVHFPGKLFQLSAQQQNCPGQYENQIEGIVIVVVSSGNHKQHQGDEGDTEEEGPDQTLADVLAVAMCQEPPEGQVDAVAAGENTACGQNAHERQQLVTLAEAEVMEEAVGNFLKLGNREKADGESGLLAEMILLGQNVGVDFQTQEGEQGAGQNGEHKGKITGSQETAFALVGFLSVFQETQSHNTQQHRRVGDHQLPDAAKTADEGEEDQKRQTEVSLPGLPADLLAESQGKSQQEEGQCDMGHVVAVIQNDPAVGNADRKQQKTAAEEECFLAETGFVEQITAGTQQQYLHDHGAAEPYKAPVTEEAEHGAVDQLSIQHTQLCGVEPVFGQDEVGRMGKVMRKHHFAGSIGVQNVFSHIVSCDRRRYETQQKKDCRPPLQKPVFRAGKSVFHGWEASCMNAAAYGGQNIVQVSVV